MNACPVSVVLDHEVTDVDRSRANRVASLLGGNGLSQTEQLKLVARVMAEHRQDPAGLLMRAVPAEPTAQV